MRTYHSTDTKKVAKVLKLLMLASELLSIGKIGQGGIYQEVRFRKKKGKAHFMYLPSHSTLYGYVV